jgi:two-component system CheB/CheR fusion protein
MRRQTAAGRFASAPGGPRATQRHRIFRYPAAFEVLEIDLLPTLLAGKTDADQIRVWVPGCATSEEVYAIAILVKDEMDRRLINPKVQIFGTDIDESAVAVARAGRYAKPNGALSTARLARWFTAEADGYRVQADSGNMYLFGRQSDQRYAVFEAGSAVVPQF